MNQRRIRIFEILTLAVAVCAAARAEIFLPDPTVFAENGAFYLTGTDSAEDGAFTLMKSADLRSWQAVGKCVAASERVGEKWFWAPQIFKHRGKYYIAYCAFGSVGGGQKHFLAIAESDRPDGDYKNSRILETASGFEIDPFVFVDTDGQPYAFFVHWDGAFGGICGQKLSPDLRSRRGKMKLLLKNTLDWEHKPLPPEFAEFNKKISDAGKHFRADKNVIEGPTVLKRRGKYVMFYSANDFRSPDYCIGVAVADSPLGKYKKLQSAPVISREITGLNGSGHGDVFFDRKGAMWYVFHFHNSPERVSPRRTAIIRLIEKFDSRGYPHYEADKSSLRIL